MCTLATLSASLLSRKGRGDREALEGLRLGVRSLEGSLGLLSQDFYPWTFVNPSSSAGGVQQKVWRQKLCTSLWRWRKFPPRGLSGRLLLFSSRLVLPRRCAYGLGVHLHLPRLAAVSALSHYLHGDSLRDLRWRTSLSPPLCSNTPPLVRGE